MVEKEIFIYLFVDVTDVGLYQRSAVCGKGIIPTSVTPTMVMSNEYVTTEIMQCRLSDGY